MNTTVLALPFTLLAACTATTSPQDGGLADAEQDSALDSSDVAITPVATVPWLRDSDGGVIIARGSNVAGEAKRRPDHLPQFGEADFTRMRDELGFNAIRLLVFWQAIEPTQGRYDDAYLAAVRRIVDAAARSRVWVLVDMHQDVYGAGFGFTGAPRWSCSEDLYAAFNPPSEWFLGYYEPQVQTCFDRLWAAGPVRDAFAAAWGRLAHELHGAPNLLAYDLVNEPSPGTASPGDFDTRIGPAAYAQLIDVIRVEDANTPIGVAPAGVANAGLASRLAPPARPNLVYVPHMYQPSLERGEGYNFDPTSAANIVRQERRDATRMQLPLMIGEFGVTQRVTNAAAYVRDAFDVLDESMTSATHWEMTRGDAYSLWDAMGQPNALAQAAARPCPRRIAGIPLSWRWNGATGEFTAAWNEDGSARGESEFALPSMVFAGGADVTLAGAGTSRIEGTSVFVPQTGGPRMLTVRRR